MIGHAIINHFSNTLVNAKSISLEGLSVVYAPKSVVLTGKHLTVDTNGSFLV